AAEGTNERGFVSGSGARHLLDRFHRALGSARETTRKSFEEDLRELDGDVAARHQLVTAWLEAYLTTLEEPADPGDLPEAVAIQLTGTMVERYESSAAVGERVTGLLGAHPRIDERFLQVRLDERSEERRVGKEGG